MAATLTGTPVAITWAAGADPAGQSITVPADCTAVYMFWAGFFDGGPASATLNGAAASQAFEVAGVTSFPTVGTGVLAWYNPATGSRTLDVAWDGAPSEGAVCIVAFVKGGDTTAWRDADGGADTSNTAPSVTLTTVAGDLVLMFDQHFHASGTAPATPAGFTSAQTHGNNNEGSRLSHISAAGTTQACTSQDADYSTVVAISIPAGSAPVSLTADQATFTLTGQAANLPVSFTCDVASFALTGQAATLVDSGGGVVDTSMTADRGIFALDGPATGLQISMAAAAGSYTLTGIDNLFGQTLAAAVATFSVSGITAGLVPSFTDSIAFQWDASTGATGYKLKWGASSGSYPNELDVGNVLSYTLSGLAAGRYYFVVVAYDGGGDSSASDELVADLTITTVALVAAAGAFTLTGQAAGLNVTMPAAASSYTLTGLDAVLTNSGDSATLAANAGSFALTGIDAASDVAMPAAVASFTETGVAAAFGQAMPIQQAAYNLVGYDVNPDPVTGTVWASGGTRRRRR